MPEVFARLQAKGKQTMAMEQARREEEEEPAPADKKKGQQPSRKELGQISISAFKEKFVKYYFDREDDLTPEDVNLPAGALEDDPQEVADRKITLLDVFAEALDSLQGDGSGWLAAGIFDEKK